jgi:hypothetical protein
VHRTATYLSGSGSNLTFRYVVQPGDTSADLDYLNISSLSGSIVDRAGNSSNLTLPTPGAVGSLSANRDIVVDTTAPTVVSITPAGASPTNAAEVQFTVVFSEPVTGVDKSAFALTTALGGASVTGVSGGGSSYTVKVSTGSGDGSLRLDLADGSAIHDAAGNAVVTTFTFGGSFEIDKTAPTVLSITAVSPSPTNATQVQYQVSFAESVSNVQTTDFSTHVTGITGASVAAVSGSGSTYLITVNTGTDSGSIRLDAQSGGNISDAAGNILGAGFTAGDVIAIDKVAPAVLSIVRADSDPTNAPLVSFDVLFSEPVFNVGAGSFGLSGSGSGGAQITQVTGSGVSYHVIVSTGTGAGTLELDFVDDDSVTDQAGNPVGGPGQQNFAGEFYTIDTQPPSITSILLSGSSPTTATTLTFNVTFSEPVSGVGTDDFQVTTNGVSGAQITGISGSGSSYSIIVSTGSGDGTIRLDLIDDDSIHDAAGNLFGGVGTQNYTSGDTAVIDRTVPHVSSIVRHAPSPTKAGSVQFDVVFSETVFNVSAADFSLITTGVSSALITGVSGSGTTYTVMVNTGTGDGSIGLNLVDHDTITDAAGNKLGGTGLNNGDFTGEVYQIDRTAPTVAVAVSGGQADPTNVLPVSFDVTFSEPVSGFTASSIQLTGTAAGLGGVLIGITNPGSDNQHFVVSVGGVTSQGTISLSVLAGVVQDAALNDNTASAAAATVTYDPVAPFVASITRNGAATTNSDSVTFLLTFSEPVLGLDIDPSGGFDNITLQATGVAGASITSISATADPKAYLVTIATGSGDGTLRLDLSSVGTIHDPAGNALPGTHTGDEIITIDRTKPTAAFASISTPRQTGISQIDLTFSEAVNTVPLGSLSLTRNGSPVSLGGASLSFAGGVYTLSGLSSLTAADGDYVLTVTAADSGIQDVAGNLLTSDAVVMFTVDGTAPTVTLTPPTLLPTHASSLVFTIAFSEPVTGVDTDPAGGFSNFTLSTTGTASGAVIAAVSATGDPKVYLVTVTGGSGEGTVQLNLQPSPTIADAAGNAVSGLPASATVTLDTVAPRINIDDGDPDNLIKGGDTLNYTIDIIDANALTTNIAPGDIVNVGSATISVGAISSSAISGGIRYTIPVTATSGGTIILRLAGTATVVDAAGNSASLPATDGDTITVDAIAPSVVVSRAAGQSPSTTSQPVHFSVAFSEPVVGFGVSSLTLGGTAGLSGVSISITNPGSDNTNFDVALSGLSGEGTVQLSVGAGVVTDPAGNGNSAGGPATVTLDFTPPSVVSIVRQTPSSALTNSSTVTYAVTFSEPVLGVDPSDFAVVTGLSGTSISNVSGSDANYTVTINTGTGEGTIRLDLVDNDSILDLAGNALGGTGAGNGNAAGQTYTVDRTRPTVAAITRLDPAITFLSTVRYRVTFSEPVSVATVNPADFTLAASGILFGTVSVAQVGTGASDSSFDVTIPNVTGEGTLTIAVNGSTATITDPAGNALNQSFSGPQYVFDHIAPTVALSLAAGQAVATKNQPIKFTAVFSEPVIGFGPGAVTRTGTAGGLAGATVLVTNPLNDFKTYDISLSGLTGDGTVTLSIPAGAVTDAGGNGNVASAFRTVTLDTTPPIVPIPQLAPGSDSGISATDKITNVTTPTFIGTVTDASLVQLFDGNRLLGSTVPSGGSWSVTTLPLADGVYNIVVRASDDAGNQAESTFLGLVIDTAGPTAIVTRALGQADAAVASSTGFTVRFNVAFDQLIPGLNASDLTILGTAGGSITGITGSGSSYIVTVGGLAQPGDVSLRANANVGTDLAGNPSQASAPGESVNVTFATQTALAVTPGTLNAGDTATATATVTAPAGSTPGGSVVFTLTGPGGPIQRTVSLTGGQAATSFTTLAAGSYSVSAVYQPVAGYAASNAMRPFSVNGQTGGGGTTPVDQNMIGQYVAASGNTVTVYDATGKLIGTFSPFNAVEAPNGIRVATADVNGDGTPDIIAVTGPGAVAQLRVYDGATQKFLYGATLFDGFTGGAFVTAGDLNNDGKADLAVTPDQGGGPRVTIYNGPDGAVLANFFAIEDPNFRGGARAAIGDVNHDGRPDIVVSAGFGGGPRVAGFDGTTLFNGVQPTHLFHDFFIFEDALRNGAYVTVGDLNNDGYGDIIGGGGPGGAPRVLALSGKDLVQTGTFTPLVNFFAGDPRLRGGVRVAAKDEDGDGKADLVTGSGDTGDLFVFFGSDLLSGNTTAKRSVQLPGVLDGVFVG